MNKIESILINTNAQRVLHYLLDYPRKEFLEKEIQVKLKISKSGTNYALRGLNRAGLIIKNNRGKQNHWSVNIANPVVQQSKVLKTTLLLYPLLDKLKNISTRIVLFGSSSRGEDTHDSDIDLLVISRNKIEIEKLLINYKKGRNIQVIVRTDLQFAELKQVDPVFYKQIEKGIILWEEENE